VLLISSKFSIAAAFHPGGDRETREPAPSRGSCHRPALHDARSRRQPPYYATFPVPLSALRASSADSAACSIARTATIPQACSCYVDQAK